MASSTLSCSIERSSVSCTFGLGLPFFFLGSTEPSRSNKRASAATFQLISSNLADKWRRVLERKRSRGGFAQIGEADADARQQDLVGAEAQLLLVVVLGTHLHFEDGAEKVAQVPQELDPVAVEP